MADKENPLLNTISRLLFKGASSSKSVKLSPYGAVRTRKFMRQRYHGLPTDHGGRKIGEPSVTTGWRRVGNSVRSATVTITRAPEGGLVGHLDTQTTELSRLGRCLYRSRRRRSMRR